MTDYGVKLIFENGDEYDDDNVFDSEDEAYEYGQDLLGSYGGGMETLNLSNPGDYPLGGDSPDIEVYEL